MSALLGSGRASFGLALDLVLASKPYRGGCKGEFKIVSSLLFGNLAIWPLFSLLSPLYSALMKPETVEEMKRLLASGLSSYGVAKALGLRNETVKYWTDPEFQRRMKEAALAWQKENPERAKDINREAARRRFERASGREPKLKPLKRKAVRKPSKPERLHRWLLSNAPSFDLGRVYFRHLGMPVAQWIEHVKRLAVERGLSADWKDGWEFSYYRPCASFDLTKEDDKAVCFHWTNILPLAKREHQRKGDAEPLGPWLPGEAVEDKTGLFEPWLLSKDRLRYVRNDMIVNEYIHENCRVIPSEG